MSCAARRSRAVRHLDTVNRALMTWEHSLHPDKDIDSSYLSVLTVDWEALTAVSYRSYGDGSFSDYFAVGATGDYFAFEATKQADTLIQANTLPSPPPIVYSFSFGEHRSPRAAPSLYEGLSSGMTWGELNKSQRLQFWPGSDAIMLWDAKGAYLASARMQEDTEQFPKRFSCGPSWPSIGIGTVSTNGFLLSVSENPNVEENTNKSTILDVRTALLWPEITLKPAPMREAGIQEGSLAPDPDFAQHQQERDDEPSSLKPQFVASNGTEWRIDVYPNADSRVYTPKAVLTKPWNEKVIAEGLSGIPSQEFYAFAISKDRQYVAISSFSTEGNVELMVWNGATGEASSNRMNVAVPLFGERKAVLDVPRAIAFTENPDVVCIAGSNGGVLLWDWRRAQPFSEMLGPYGKYAFVSVSERLVENDFSDMSIEVSPGWIIVKGRNEKHFVERRYEVGFGPLTAPVSPLLLRLAEAMGGVQFDGNGVVRSQDDATPGDQVRRLRGEFAKADESDPSIRLGRWLLSDRATRTVSPNSKVTITETFQMLLKLGAFDDAELLTFGDPAKVKAVQEERAKFSKPNL